ncbi:MAG: discoidin domain-containing protein [Fermentimonas sp.]|jgi:hypothetical protein
MKLKIRLFIGAAITALLLHSCSEPYAESIELERFMYLSLSGSVDNPVVKKIDLDENFTFPLNVSYGGTTNYNQGEIVAQIAPDVSLVSAYNEENNTTYRTLPAGSYSLNKTSVTIEDGKNFSDVITLTVDPSKVNFAYSYLLPVTIQSVTSEKIPVNDEFKTLYLVLEGNANMQANEHLWTVAGSSSVWQKGFEVEKAWDLDRRTMWHSALNGMPQWFAVNMNDYKFIDGFTWVNRQDVNQHALPKHVIFETSMDGENWNQVLEIEALPNNRILQVFELPERVVAKYFKVNVLTNWANAPYTYVAEVSTWAGEKPTGDYDWEKNTWQIVGFKSQWNDSNWAVKNIFDGNKNTPWHSEPFDAAKNGMPQWFIVDMMKPRPAIKGFLIWNRQDDRGCEPKHVVFSISSDGEQWTVILDLPQMSNDNSVELDYKTTNPVAGRYLKVEVKSNWAGMPWTYFGEITPY